MLCCVCVSVISSGRWRSIFDAWALFLFHSFFYSFILSFLSRWCLLGRPVVSASFQLFFLFRSLCFFCIIHFTPLWPASHSDNGRAVFLEKKNSSCRFFSLPPLPFAFLSNIFHPLFEILCYWITSDDDDDDNNDACVSVLSLMFCSWNSHWK